MYHSGQEDPSMKKDAIITFLNRMASLTANLMPDNSERHLPFVSNLSVFHQFQKEFSILYPNSSCPSENYFYHTWRHHCFDIKVRIAIRFTRCGTCERIHKALLHAVTKNLPTDALL